MNWDYEARLRARRAFGTVVPLALLATAGWVTASSNVGGTVEDGSGVLGGVVAQPQDQPEPQDTAVGSTLPTAVPSQPATPRGLADVDKIRVGLPDGPGTTKPGIYLEVTPERDSLVVAEVVWFQRPTREVVLSPPDVSLGGSQFAQATPTLTQVRVVAGGREVYTSQDPVASQVRVPLPEEVNKIELTYRVHDVVKESQPSAAGRALGVVGPITQVGEGSLPVSVVAEGPGVLNLSCPLLAAAEQGCATSGRDGIRVGAEIAAVRAIVILQLDVRAL